MPKAKKMLIRPLEGRMVAGVCMAFSNYFNVDVSLIRIVWVIFFIPGGIPGLVPYIICWIIIPSD